MLLAIWLDLTNQSSYVLWNLIMMSAPGCIVSTPYKNTFVSPKFKFMAKTIYFVDFKARMKLNGL